ncbi:helix-turn-helix domain-containing protein [Halomicroarcula sp. F13]|uniref:Helix-turn-helix domain-containing protein n=2 Tax=Haloarcula rubra TaxID=2487747 RepID=A0AAW4PUZ8_9EURY|nr:helix-turn-helix domain-containing protein [Halomicroarcula rubra]
MGMTSVDPTGSAVKLEFELLDRDCFFVDASAVADCRVTLEHMVNRSDDRLLEYFTVEGTAPDRVLSMVEETAVIDEARLISRGVDGGLFEFVVSGPCVTTTLADTGAIARSVLADEGIGEIVADVPAHVDVRRVAEQFGDQYPESTLTACRNSNEPVPVRTESGVHATMADQLTDKQQEVLRTAYLSGYFSWPRRSSAEECADALGIAQSTFSQHIRTAEEKVIGRLFESGVEQ